MANTTFSGPVRAGSIKETTGTTLGSDVTNVGQVVMSQSEAISQSTTAASTDIVIPAGSQILEIAVYVTTAWDNSSTLTVGTSATATELVTAMAVSTINTIDLATGATLTDVDLFENVGTSDIRIWVDSSATTADAGRGVITVTYVQAAGLVSVA